MTRRLEQSPRARRDLLDIWAYVALERPVAADKLLDRFGEVAEMLARNPKMGRERHELADGIRSFPVGRYLIFYREIDRGIRIIRVLHGARNITLLDD